MSVISLRKIEEVLLLVHRGSYLQKLDFLFFLNFHQGSEAVSTHFNANMEVSNAFQLFRHPCLPRIPLMDDAPTASDGEAKCNAL